jgi:replication-associated recombination protein RarA
MKSWQLEAGIMQQQLSELLRPTSLTDLVQPLDLIQRLDRMVKAGSLLNMLFYGQPGIGKTSAARIMLRELNADPYEINGSMTTGVDSIRENLELYCGSHSLYGGQKVVFIDECEYLSANAQAALRGVIERFPSTRFLLTANDIRKLQPALKSRCMPVCFDMSLEEANESIGRLMPRYQTKIAAAGYVIPSERLRAIMYLKFPDLRAIANSLEFEAVRNAA